MNGLNYLVIHCLWDPAPIQICLFTLLDTGLASLDFEKDDVFRGRCIFMEQNKCKATYLVDLMTEQQIWPWIPSYH